MKTERFYILWLMMLCIQQILNAQTVIEGTYDKQYNRFIPHVNLLGNGMNAMYEVETMVQGYGVIGNKAKRFGVIDSSGRVVVPLEYDKLESCRLQKAHFIFQKDRKMGIIGHNGNENCVIPMEGNNGRRNGIFESKVAGLFYFLLNGKRGLFDMMSSKTLIPAIYDDSNFLNETYEKSRRKHAWMFMNDTLAIVKKSDTLFVYDLRSGIRSLPFHDVVLLNSGQLFLKGFDGFVAVSGDFLKPINSLPFRVLDSYNNYIIGRNASGYGMTKDDGTIAVPFIYEDIYFCNKDVVWLKKDGLWAMSTYAYELKSNFEFEEIEKSNDWFIHQLLEVTKLDTTDGNLYVEKDYAGINRCPTEIKKLIYQTQLLKDTKRIFNTYLDYMRCANWGAAKRADGWHLTYPPLGQIEPEAWTELRLVPDNVDPYGMRAFNKNGKWGVEKDDVKYEGVLYDSLELTINCHNGCIIKSGNIYSYTTNYSINMKDNCYWEKNIKWIDYVVR